MRAFPDAAFEKLSRYLQVQYRIPQHFDLRTELADVIDEDSGEACYRRLVLHWNHPAKIVRGEVELNTFLDSRNACRRCPECASA